MVLLFSSVSNASSQDIFYVKPSELPSLRCPGQPCLTLDQYAQRVSEYFTTGSTFLFLAGNHALVSAVPLVNISDITFRGHENRLSQISCYSGIFLKNVTDLTIDGVLFSLQFKRLEENFSAINIMNSQEIMIINSTFLGTEDLTLPLARAINISHSNIVIISCYFEGNTGQFGAAIYATLGSTITLINNHFTRNKANISGGAVFAKG